MEAFDFLGEIFPWIVVLVLTVVMLEKVNT